MADEFQITYDGDALATHAMDVRTLAPSLMALGDALLAAHNALGENGHAPTLKINATSGGSFNVDLLVDTLSSDGPTALANALAITNGPGNLWEAVKGALRLTKWLGKRNSAITQDAAAGEITYVDTNGSTLTVPMGASVLISNGEFRAAISSFTQPLDSDGIDKMNIDGASADEVVIEKQDRDAFHYEPRDTELDQSTRTATVKVETVQLGDRDRKWWFSEDGETFTARVTDESFLLAVRSGRSAVGADDSLLVRMEEKTFRRATGGVRIERTVLEVLRHDRAPQQGELDYKF